MGCNDCHTPKKMGPRGPEPDVTRLLSGHPEGVKLPPPPLPGPWIAMTNADPSAWAGPWGITYAFNLTPDENTGMGNWSEETFTKAMREGAGGRSPDPATDALGGHQPSGRPRPQGDLRLPAYDTGYQEPGSRGRDCPPARRDPVTSGGRGRGRTSFTSQFHEPIIQPPGFLVVCQNAIGCDAWFV
jgi:hypothetical protein